MFFAGSEVYTDGQFSDLLNEYLFFELGKTKKNTFNLMTLTNSLRLSNSNRKLFT